MEKQPRFTVSTVTHYLESQSDPEIPRYAFSYTITIENIGTIDAKLLRRHWVITDANGKEMVVDGEGVVGEQPLIAVDDHYVYTSGTLIETPLGVMEGHYIFVTADGTEYQIAIPPFRLALPNMLH
uniref:Co2+/Mg2+ efflux protein ApaG n=1 Tax=Thaumasiovibrio occultus TaxID=1891184 RepID=UPI000B35CF5F|nr:Co2+/Mg2+ efflux protein ApaG [Thaumasiovibrio occultus]